MPNFDMEDEEPLFDDEDELAEVPDFDVEDEEPVFDDYELEEQDDEAEVGGSRVTFRKQSRSGKCLTSSGRDPPYKYYHAVGAARCESYCRSNSRCGGYTINNHRNCLIWLTSSLKSGGENWGGARCYIKTKASNPTRRPTRKPTQRPGRPTRRPTRRGESRVGAGSEPAYTRQSRTGKCLTSRGQDPAYKYYHGVGKA